jgi:hypothetical protein
MNQKIFNSLLQVQKREITKYHIYLFLSKKTAGKNKKIIKKIAHQEKNIMRF